MSKELFMKKLQMFQSSSAPVAVKEKAINELKQKYFDMESSGKNKMLLSSIDASSSELKADELF